MIEAGNQVQKRTDKSESKRWLILILGVTALARIIVLILSARSMSFQTSGYDVYATHLIEGHGYTRYDDRNADSDLPPLYPLFLAGVYSLFGRDPIPVATIQIGFDLCTTLILYVIGKRISNAKVGLLAAGFYGLYPYLLYQNLTLNDTGIFILLLATSVWLAYRVYDAHSWGYAAALGATIGLAALTKTFIVALMPLLAVWWYQHLGRSKSTRLSLVSGLVLLAIITPWIVRNIMVQKDFVLISTNGGSNFHQGNNACVVDYLARGWDAQWADCLGTPPDGLTEVEEDRWHTRQATEYLLSHVGEWPRLFGTKLMALWSPVLMPVSVPSEIPPGESLVLRYQSPLFQVARIVHLLYFGLLLILAIPGLIWAWRDKLPVGPLISVFVVITLVYVIFHPSTRYRSPADPFICIFSAVALTQLWEWVKARLQRSGLLQPVTQRD